MIDRDRYGKVCTVCACWQPWDNYHLNGRAWDRRRSMCKTCVRLRRERKKAERHAGG